MKKIPLLFLCLYICCDAVLSQPLYEKWIVGMIFYGQDGKVMPDHSTTITGKIYPYSPVIITTDSIGYPLSGNTLNMTGRNCTPERSIINSDNRILFFTQSRSTSSQENQALLTKFDASPSILWSYHYVDTVYDVSVPTSLFLASDSNYVMGITCSDTVPPYSSSLRIINVDASGNVLWTQNIPAQFVITQIARANDGGYVGLGMLNNTHRIYFKTDSFFSLQWAHKYSAAFTFQGEQIAQLPNNDICIFSGIKDTSWTVNSTTFHFSRTMVLMKIDAVTGNLVSNREIDFVSPAVPEHLQFTSDGYPLAFGYYYNGSFLITSLFKWEAFLVKMDADGNIIWADTLSMSSFRSSIWSVKESENRFLVLALRYDHINPWNQFFVTDTSANEVCNLKRGLFQSLSSVTIIDSVYSLPAFLPGQAQRFAASPYLNPYTLISGYFCGDFPTGTGEVHLNDLKVEANIFSSQLIINFSDLINDEIVFRLFDISGKEIPLLHPEREGHQCIFDLHFIANGLYFLHAESKNNLQTFKVVKIN
ncbi:MAG: T9SS type A sorting domain-containing protein [Bacteroidia bacterium]|nr:T9SS type A sorting domain-containing protein [Bacteroidia bacterium]